MDKDISVKHILLPIVIFFILSICILFRLTNDMGVFLLFFIFAILMVLYISLLWIRLSHHTLLFKDQLHHTIDCMIKSEFTPTELTYDESAYSHITQHLYQLYYILHKTKNEVNLEKIELQELITDISHQIKTPMTTLKLAEAAMVKAINQPDEILELIKTNSSHLNKLSFLLSSLITASRLETGIINLSPSLTNVSATILSALEHIALAATEKKIKISFKYTDKYFALYDSKWTAEAIFNILDNAVKYTGEHGSISVDVSALNMYVKISIQDTGMGVLESEIPKIFQRFYRSESAKECSGVGIGLYLTRDIITRQHGFIHVSSSIGQGSIFDIYLPNYQ